MTVLNKKTYAGLSVQKAKITLLISIPSLGFVMIALLAMLFISNKSSNSSFRFFVGIDVQEDIQILYDENNSHDEFNQYEVCFQAGPASIEKIIAHNELILVQEIPAINKAALRCVGSQGNRSQYMKPRNEKSSFSHHKEILLYNETTQTAWYNIDSVN